MDTVPLSAADLVAVRRGDRRHSLCLIDGPNMSNLRDGGRDRRTYGTITSLSALHEQMQQVARRLGVDLETVVSNHEGELLEHVHRAADRIDAWLINPAGLNLQGAALREALADTCRPVVELHFANIAAIGYPVTLFTAGATAMTCGLRQHGYVASLLGLICALDDSSFLGAAHS